jgi:hypothetical protein
MAPHTRPAAAATLDNNPGGGATFGVGAIRRRQLIVVLWSRSRPPDCKLLVSGHFQAD